MGYGKEEVNRSNVFLRKPQITLITLIFLGAVKSTTKSFIINHERTRINTNFQSTEYTEETEGLADVGHRSEEFVDNIRF